MTFAPLFVDADVMIDLFTKRNPFHTPAEEFFNQVEQKQIRSFTSPIAIANAHYIVRKTLSDSVARQALQKLSLIIKVLPVTQKEIDLALQSSLPDFEDAIQYFTARENGLRCIVTRNTRDYPARDLSVCTPEEWLAQRKFS